MSVCIFISVPIFMGCIKYKQPLTSLKHTLNLCAVAEVNKGFHTNISTCQVFTLYTTHELPTFYTTKNFSSIFLIWNTSGLKQNTLFICLSLLQSTYSHCSFNHIAIYGYSPLVSDL